MQLKQPFPRETVKHLQMQMIVDSNVANTIDFVSKELHLSLICFDEVFEHLLRANVYFKMMAVLLESLGSIAQIYFVTYTHIFSKRIIGAPKNIQCVSHRWKVKLRVMTRHKVFVAAIITNNLEPWSIWFESEDQLGSTNQIPEETVLEVKCLAIGELHDGMPCIRIEI